MTRLLLSLLLLPASVLAAGIGTASYQPVKPIRAAVQRPALNATVLKVTGSALVACAVADVVTTEFGHGIESNPLIPTRANGKPHWGVYVAKVGGSLALILIERKILKRKPDATGALAIGNAITAGIWCGAAIHNGRLR